MKYNSTRLLLLPAALVAGLMLAACQQTGTVSSALPTVPADIQSCFRQGAVAIPDRALTVADVESLWKKDRVRIAVQRSCGQRFLAWYADLQQRWR